jgi:N-acetylglutamate synthase
VLASGFLDQLMADAWPAEVTEYVGSSRLRWASGVTRRANSCLAIGDDDQIPEIVARATDFYTARAAVPLFLVSTASAPPAMPSHLKSLGFESAAHTFIQTASSAVVAATASDPDAWDAEVTSELNDAWFETYWEAESSDHRPDRSRSIYRDVLPCADKAAYVAVVESGVTVAVGQIVVRDGWAGIQCMATNPTHRRQGAAGRVLAHLAQQALARDAPNMYLAVMAENQGAQRLYERIGFSTAHDYCYYVQQEQFE